MSAKIFHVENYDSRTNFCDHFSEPIRVTTVYKGIELWGHFTFISPSDHSLVIDSPYSGIKTGSHTPYFAMFKENRNVVDGTLTDKCFKAGENSLIAAYEEADFLFQYKEDIYKKILHADPEIKKLSGELELFRAEFLKEKKRLKALFKSGEILQREYSDYLKEGRKKMDNFSFDISDIKREIFSDLPDFLLKYGQEDQDIAFVRKYLEA